MRKFARGIILSIVICISFGMHTYAYTAEDLYSELDIEYVDPHSQEDIDIMTKYRYAKKYTRIFSHLSSMSFEELDLDTMEETISTRLDDITKSLNNAYTLSESSIYELEAEYRETADTLVEIHKLYDMQEIELKGLNIADIPTYDEYTQASARKMLVDTQCELGNGRPRLTPSAYVVIDSTDSSITVGTVHLAVITSLFNGEVIDIREDIVTIDHYNGIYTSYKGITPVVDTGDRVYQGMCVGHSSGSVTLRMKVGDVFIDIDKYLKGKENEEV